MVAKQTRLREESEFVGEAIIERNTIRVPAFGLVVRFDRHCVYSSVFSELAERSFCSLQK